MPERDDAEGALARRLPFGRWLLEQHDRDDWVGELAMAGRGDRGFPKDGDPEAVRASAQATGGR